MRVSLASDSWETAQVIIVKLGMVTTSDMGMHHVLIIFTLTFTEGHIDLNPFSAILPYTLITLCQVAWLQHTHMSACLAHTADKLSRITKTSISQKLWGQFYSLFLHFVQT